MKTGRFANPDGTPSLHPAHTALPARAAQPAALGTLAMPNQPTGPSHRRAHRRAKLSHHCDHHDHQGGHDGRGAQDGHHIAWIETRYPGGWWINRRAALTTLRHHHPTAHHISILEQWHIPLSHRAFKIYFET